MDLKKAYEILGLPEDADMKQVDHRYFILSRRHRKAQSQQEQQKTDADQQETNDFSEINAAYNFLIAHFRELAMADNPVYQAEQMKSPFRKKVEHFYMYYRWHTVGAIALIIAIVAMVNTIIHKQNEIPADAEVMLVGTYYIQETIPLEESLTATVPEWQRVKVTVAFSPDPEAQPNSFDAAYLQKAIALLATERPDLYIVDDFQLQRIGQQGAFMPLDAYESHFLQMLEPEQLIYVQFPEDSEEHLYGIDLTDSAVFEGLLSEQVKKIVTIRQNAGNIEIGLKLLNAMIENEPAL